MLELKNVSIKFSGFSLDDISLVVAENEYHMLLGPSGSGKTLLMNIIAGFQRIDTGEIYFNGNDITHLPPQKREISYLFQDLALFPHLTVFENVAFPLKIRHLAKNEVEVKVMKYLDFTGTSHLKDRGINKLSGGEKQRVALARMLITESKMLMLDEPFSALDTSLKLDLKKLLKKISGLGVSILHITHNYEEAISLAEKLTVIEHGKIISSAAFKDISTLLTNQFTASLSGERNYFIIQDIISNSDLHILMLSAGKNSDFSMPVVYSGDLPEKPATCVIPGNQILLSSTRLHSSARNHFEASVMTVFRTENGFELELCPIVDAFKHEEMSFWVKITRLSYESLQVQLNQTLWISFKASAPLIF